VSFLKNLPTVACWRRLTERRNGYESELKNSSKILLFFYGLIGIGIVEIKESTSGVGAPYLSLWEVF
jgi:hypothetical protein